MTNEEIQRALLAYNGQPAQPAQQPWEASAQQAMQTLEQPVADQAYGAAMGASPPMQTLETRQPAKPAAPVNPYQQLGQAITESSNAQQQALAAQQEALNRAAIDRDVAMEGRAMEVEQELADSQQRNSAFQAEQSARMKEAQAFLKQADQPIADRRTIGNKVAGAIAIALSGFGDAIAAKGGNRNTGHMQRTMSLIDEQVNRDIQMQRDNLANKRAAAGAKFTEMGIAQGMFADQERAIQFGSSLRKEAYADEMLRIAQNVQDAEKASALTQQGETIKQNEKLQRFKLAQDELEDKRRRAAAAAAQQARLRVAQANTPEELLSIGTKEAMEKAKALAELDAKKLEGAKTEAETLKLRGEAGAAGPQEMLPGYMATQSLKSGPEAEARKIYSAGQSIKADLRRLSEMRRNNNGASWNKDDIREARQILNSLPSRYSQMFGSGAPNNTELELFAASLVDPTDVSLRGDVEETYRRLEQQIDRTAEAQLSGYGMRKIDPRESFTAAPTGGAAPAQRAPNAPAAPQMVPMLNRRGALEMVHPSKVEQAQSFGYELAENYDPILNRKKAEAAAKAASAPAPAPVMAPPPNTADMTDEEYARYVAADRGDL